MPRLPLALLTIAALVSGAAGTEKEEPAPATPSRYRIQRVHLPPGPGGTQAAVSRGRYQVNFGSRDGVRKGSIFQVYTENTLVGLVRVERVWRDSAHVGLVALMEHVRSSAPTPLRRGFYLEPKFVTLETVYFDAGEPEFSAEMHDRLRAAARFIRAFPDSPLILEGHTDITGKKAENTRLALERAEKVRTHLYEVHRLPMGQMRLEARGSTEPIATNATEEGRRLNRRVEIILVDRPATAPARQDSQKTE